MAGSNDFILHLSIEPVTSAKELQNSVNKIVKGVNPDAIQPVIDDKQTKSQIEKLLDLMADLKQGVEVPITVTGTAVDDIGKIKDAVNDLRYTVSSTVDSIESMLSNITARVPSNISEFKNVIGQMKEQINDLTSNIQKDVEFKGSPNKILGNMTKSLAEYERRATALMQRVSEVGDLTKWQNVPDEFKERFELVANAIRNTCEEIETLKSRMENAKGILTESQLKKGVDKLPEYEQGLIEKLVQEFNELNEYLPARFSGRIDTLNEAFAGLANGANALDAIYEKLNTVDRKLHALTNTAEMAPAFKDSITAIEGYISKLSELVDNIKILKEPIDIKLVEGANLTSQVNNLLALLRPLTDQVTIPMYLSDSIFSDLNSVIAQIDKIKEAGAEAGKGLSAALSDATVSASKTMEGATSGSVLNTDKLKAQFDTLYDAVGSKLYEGIKDVNIGAKLSTVLSRVDRTANDYVRRFENVKKILNSFFEIDPNLPNEFKQQLTAVETEIDTYIERIRSAREEIYSSISGIQKSQYKNIMPREMDNRTFRMFESEILKFNGLYDSFASNQPLVSSIDTLYKKLFDTKTQAESLGQVDVSSPFSNVSAIIDECARKISELATSISTVIDTTIGNISKIGTAIDEVGQKGVTAGENIARAFSDAAVSGNKPSENIAAGMTAQIDNTVTSSSSNIDLLRGKLVELREEAKSLTAGIEPINIDSFYDKGYKVTDVIELMKLNTNDYDERVRKLRADLDDIKAFVKANDMSDAFAGQIGEIEKAIASLESRYKQSMRTIDEIDDFSDRLVKWRREGKAYELAFSDDDFDRAKTEFRFFIDDVNQLGNILEPNGERIGSIIGDVLKGLPGSTSVLDEATIKIGEAGAQIQSLNNIEVPSVFEKIVKAIEDCSNKLSELITNLGGNVATGISDSTESVVNSESSKIDILREKLAQLRDDANSLAKDVKPINIATFDAKGYSYSKVIDLMYQNADDYSEKVLHLLCEIDDIKIFARATGLSDTFIAEISKIEDAVTSLHTKCDDAYLDTEALYSTVDRWDRKELASVFLFGDDEASAERRSVIKYLNDLGTSLQTNGAEIGSFIDGIIKKLPGSESAISETAAKVGDIKTQAQSLNDVDASTGFNNILSAITGCNDKLIELVQNLTAIGTTIDELGNKSITVSENISKSITNAVARISYMLNGITVGDEITRVQEQLTSLLTGATSTDTTGNVGDIMQNALVSITEYEQRLNSLAQSLAELRQFLDANGMQDKFVDITSGAATEIEKARTSISGLKSDMENFSSGLTSTDKSGGMDKLFPIQEGVLSGYIAQLDEQKAKVQQIAQGISDGLAKILADVPTQTNVLDTTASKVESVKTQAQGLQGVDLGAVFSSANGAISECSNKLSDLAGKLTTIIEILNTKSFGSGISSMATEIGESFKSVESSTSASLNTVSESAKNAEASVSRSLVLISGDVKKARDEIANFGQNTFKVSPRQTVGNMLEYVDETIGNMYRDMPRLFSRLRELQANANGNGITIFDDIVAKAEKAYAETNEEVGKISGLFENLNNRVSANAKGKTLDKLTSKQTEIFLDPFRQIVNGLTEQKEKIKGIVGEIVDSINEVYRTNTKSDLTPMVDNVSEVRDVLKDIMSDKLSSILYPDMNKNTLDLFNDIRAYGGRVIQELTNEINSAKALIYNSAIPKDDTFFANMDSLVAELRSKLSSLSAVFTEFYSTKISRDDYYKPIGEVPDLQDKFNQFLGTFDNARDRAKAIAQEMINEITRVYSLGEAAPQAEQLTAPIDKMQSSIQSIDPNVMNALASAIEKVTGIVSECNSKLSDMVTKLGDIFNTISGESGFGAIGKFASDILTEIGKVREGFDSLSKVMSDFKVNIDLTGIKNVGNTAEQVAMEMGDSFKSAESSVAGSIKETEASTSESLGVMADEAKELRDKITKGFIPRSIEPNTNVKNTLSQLNVAADECAKHFDDLQLQVCSFINFDGYYNNGKSTPLGETIYAKWKELNATVKEFKNIPNLTNTLTEQLTDNELRRRPKNLSSDMGNRFNDIIAKLEEQKTRAQTLVQEIVDELNKVYNFDGSGATSGGTSAELDVSKMFGNVDLSSQIGNMNALVGSINEAVNAIKNMLGNTEGLKEKLASLDVSKLSQSLEGIVPRIDECVKKMRELGDAVKTIGSTLGSEGVADTMTKINGAMDAITNNSGKLIGVLERLDTYLSKAGGTNPLSQQAEQAGASAAKISDALSSIDVNALGGLTTAIADAVAALERLKDMASSFSKIEIKFDSTQLSTLVEQLTSIFQKLLESGNASNTASAAFSNAGSAIHTVAEEAKATTTVIDEMNQSLAKSNLEVLTNATSQYSDVNKEELARIANSYANLGQSIESAKVQITDAAETGAQELQLLVTATNSAKQAVEETFNVGTMTTQLAEQTQQTSEEYYKAGESVDVLRQKLLYLYDAISRLPKNVVSKVIADEIDSIKQSFASTANGLDSFLKGQITDPAVLKDMETEADNLLERIINLRKVGVFDNISAGAEVASQNLRELNALVEETNSAYNFVLAGADRVINKDISGLGAYTPFYESMLAELRAQKDRLATQMGAVNDKSVTRETVAVANDLIAAMQQLVTLADAMGNLNKLELLPNFKDKADEVEAVKAAFESLYKSYKKIEGLKNTKQLPTYLNEQVSTLESKFNDLQTAALNIFKDGISSENDIRTFAQLAPEVYNLVNAINTASEAEKNYSSTTSGMVRNVSTQIQKMVKAESDRAKMTYKENAGGLQNFMALQQQSGKMIEMVRSINEFAKTNKGDTGDIGETMANNIEMAKEYAKRLSELRDGLSEYAEVAKTTMKGDEVTGFGTRIEAVRVALTNMIGALNGANSETGVSATNINETNNALAIALGNLEAYARGTMEATRATREANKVDNDREKTLRRLEDVRKRVAIALNVGSGAKFSNKTEVTEAYADLKKLADQLDDLKRKLRTNDERGRLVGVGIDEAKRDLEKFTGRLRENESALKSNGFYMKSFGQRMKEVANYFATWFSMSRMIMQTIRTIKNMIKTSIELDDAMTQMQIVTHANSNTMKEFADSAADAAKRIGSSITDFMSSATTFARLGYNMEESSQLAEYVAMLQNVGNIDTQDAQDAVTAIIKAFDIDTDQIESVMDKLVVVGNGFPISVEQIAEGMTNASSSLAAAGNSFEQSVALLTGSNAVVQNASKAATGLRTITARLRNTKTELDDLGEAMTSSQYDELTRALTKQGVALVNINGEYRSTYDIISDIAKVWDNMTSMEQSALATLMSGKLCARMYRNMHRRHI